MTAIRPILVSLGLHSLAVLLLALVPFGVKAMLEHRQIIATELVNLDTPMNEKPAAPQQPRASVPPERSDTRPTVQNAVLNAEQAVAEKEPVDYQNSAQKPVQKPVSGRVMKAVARFHVADRPGSTPVTSIIQHSPQAVPEFIAIPPGSAGGFAGARPGDRDLDLGQDAGPAVASLSIAGGGPPLRRSVPASPVAMPRVLRDSSAEYAATARSQVKPGNNLRPEYPRLAREAGWEGTVMLTVEVLSDGKAGTVTVHKTSGHTVLDEAAVSAVQRWHFTPAMDGNFPVSAVVHLPVKFDLRAP